MHYAIYYFTFITNKVEAPYPYHCANIDTCFQCERSPQEVLSFTFNSKAEFKMTILQHLNRLGRIVKVIVASTESFPMQSLLTFSYRTYSQQNLHLAASLFVDLFLSSMIIYIIILAAKESDGETFITERKQNLEKLL